MNGILLMNSQRRNWFTNFVKLLTLIIELGLEDKESLCVALFLRNSVEVLSKDNAVGGSLSRLVWLIASNFNFLL